MSESADEELGAGTSLDINAALGKSNGSLVADTRVVWVGRQLEKDEKSR